MSELNIAELLADQLEKLLAAEVSAESLAALENGTGNRALWQHIEAMGVADVMCTGAEAAGLGWQECAELFRVLGRHAAPLPLAETLLGRRLLSQAGLAIPEGPLALVDADISLDDAGCLQGAADMISWAPWATAILGIARRGAETLLFSVAGTAVSAAATELHSLERAPTAAIDFSGMTPQAQAPIAAEASIREQLAVVRALLISGACDKVVELAVEYANTRKQFGKPIGKFQALQHQLAEASCRAAAAEMAAKYACRELDQKQPSTGAAVAKYTASVAAREVSRIAHQVFGAIGITDEHELHYFTRRLWQWRVDAGNERYWSGQLGARVLAAGSAQLWPSLTA
ncbi:MAG: acyl-CoA dehydrogenase [Gammaproteobacteria bacterium]|uniref:acyl-CoA dehydrogenase family protein n=1 Tax=Pseudomaricurvus alcaniphilus TaxID=1166482 RepID=UPI00140835AB|nr:acyl-CoA dehydrogenase family protein [Pseudomaricurvus alcaniphilus]MBR9910833.1 acyl-CoA dehydrogenase [Gammaproteobacteria bacterium]NHN37289.1 acyl-CoA dehydrogenase [Pseudomaricurvus alcaniphilus]